MALIKNTDKPLKRLLKVLVLSTWCPKDGFIYPHAKVWSFVSFSSKEKYVSIFQGVQHIPELYDRAVKLQQVKFWINTECMLLGQASSFIIR